MTTPRQKLLIITHDAIDEQMAGPAIRCWELAKQLSRTCDVTLTSKIRATRSHPDFVTTSFSEDQATLLAQAGAADILLVQGLMLRFYPPLLSLGKYLVVDLYDPFVIESYPYFESQGLRRDATYVELVDVMDEQMRAGDFFICASERQRDMWLGRFCALARLTPALFAEDPSMTKLIDLVPFGLPDHPPEPAKPVLRGVVPGIGPDDVVLLWGGGVWNWFDPLTVIRAVAELSHERDDIKLYFLGMKHPNPEIPAMAMAASALALAEELGVKDTHVFFNHGWVSYDERQAYLNESTAGVSAHFDSVETRFSFRTRVLDYFWGSLPVLSTEGDGMSELVARERLGLVLGYGDVEGWKAAIRRLADDPLERNAMRERVRAIAEGFRWSEVVKPLARYCAAPYRGPQVLKGLAPQPEGPFLPMSERPSLLTKGWRVLSREGGGAFFRKGVRYMRKRGLLAPGGPADA